MLANTAKQAMSSAHACRLFLEPTATTFSLLQEYHPQFDVALQVYTVNINLFFCLFLFLL